MGLNNVEYELELVFGIQLKPGNIFRILYIGYGWIAACLQPF